MDKVLSARVDEKVIRRIGLLARRLGTTKKAVIERAVTELCEAVDADAGTDAFAATCGAWQRDEPPEQTVAAARRAFRDGAERHHR